ncbi:3-oxo-Delta(4,5)-steroid 5-beta-reductase [Cytospora mali]|uniref:3-oxo-Delta(4,5)-steroid 5-beta-reductase n=1 Tax=Cytospora mali TaxID=578113 RepID=A0A194VPE8_CYTMA|nr:3-oxo-Delta(4,5)-steroid 5-beta-reductase [Valsa mali]
MVINSKPKSLDTNGHASTSPEGQTALVFGASGISGWAVMQNLLSYPSPTTFRRIIGLTNRPLSKAEGSFPEYDKRVELYFGIDLRQDLGGVKTQLMNTIPRLEEVTHVYYCAYSNATAYSENVMAIRDINVGMTSNAVYASDAVMPSLKFFVLQTGTNHYGVAVFRYLDKIKINPPLREETPRIPSPYGDEIFYYAQVDVLKQASKGKRWGWCEVRPDQIIGVVPNPTSMTYIEPLALYLALYRFVHGPGAVVKFPGTKSNFTYTYTDSSQDMIARAEIFLSVQRPGEADGEAFNIADTATPGPWSVKWPVLAEYFGLKAAGPGDKGWEGIDDWWFEHQDEYQKMCDRFGLKRRNITRETWVFLKCGFTLLDINREMSLDKIRSVGFTEEKKVGEGHRLGFDRMAALKILPSKEDWESV